MYRKLFRKLILVQTLSILSNTMAVIVDSSITSMFLGEKALLATGIVMPLLLFMATIGGAVAVGFQTVVARKLGQGDNDGATSSFNYILLFVLIITIISIFLILLFLDPIAKILGTTYGTYEYNQVIGYLKGYVIGIPAYSLMLLLIPVMFIDSDKNRVTVAIIAMIIVDILLDLLNVFVIKQELFGMAVASSISYIVAAFILLLHFKIKTNIIKLNIKSARPIDLKTIIKNSSTYTIYHICKSILVFAVNWLLITFGMPEKVAVFAVFSSLTLVLTSAGSAMGSVTLSFSSLFYGENDISREKQLRKTFIWHSLIICGAITIITITFAPSISKLFIKPDSSQFNSCVIGLRLLSLSIIFNAINSCYRNYFQGINKLVNSNIVCIIQYLVGPICSLYILLSLNTGQLIWLFYLTAEVFTLLVVILFNFKNKEPDLLDKEMFITNSNDLKTSIDTFKQILIKNKTTESKMEIVNRIVECAIKLFNDINRYKTELNVRAYEINDELKCSIETNVNDENGLMKHLININQNDIIYSEVFGLKRVIIGNLRND